MTLIDTSSLPMDHPALVPDFWTRAMLANPHVTPDLKSKALAQAGLPESDAMDSDLAVTQYHEASILQFLSQQLDDPLFAAKAGTSHDPSKGTILTYISMSAATLHDLLVLAERYIPITRTRARMTVEFSPNGAVLVAGNARSEIENDPDHVEFAIGALIHTMETAVGQSLPLTVKFGHECRPIDALSEIYGCRVLRHNRRAEIHFPEHSLHLPILSADDRLLRHLVAYADILLKSRRRSADSTRERIESVVLPKLSQGVPSLKQVAESMGQSPRTLSRRLAQEHLTFRQVVETLRYDLARHYLANPDLPLAEIAFLLGFADQSSFGTAFRRWTGNTPRSYRNAL